MDFCGSNFSQLFRSTLIAFLLNGYCFRSCSSSDSHEPCHAAYLSSDGYVPGRCVNFPECPPLMNLIKSPSLTGAEVKLLQSLTCSIDDDVPTICCGLTDIKELANYNIEGLSQSTSKSPSVGDIIVYPEPPANSKPVFSDTTNYKPEIDINSNADIGGRLKVQTQSRNFDLLPKLEECGTPMAWSSDRIVGGNDTEHGAYPWMARVGYRHVQSGEVEFYCGATVISKKYVLTAAHCSEEIDKTEYKPAVIRLGEHNSDTDLDCSNQFNCSRAVDLRIEKIIHHPGYNLDNKTNDIELIRVYGNIPYNTPFVKPVCLPFAKEYGIQKSIRDDMNQFVSRKGVVTGWGRTKWEKIDGSPVMQQVLLPIVSNEECQRNYSTKIELWDKQMCAGGMVDKDSCGGDSGGPIVIPLSVQQDGVKLRPKYFQLGVVSFGPTHCGVGGLPGVYTRVAAYKDWILENLEP